MIFDKTRRTYSFIQWGLFVFVLMCPFLSFAQGFINYQAFIYEKVKIVQPGRDMEQMVPYAKFPVNVLVKLITKNDTLLFEEEHDEDTTDAMGMLNLRIGSEDSVEFNNIPWSSLSQDSVILIISVFNPKSGRLIYTDSSLLSVSPFSIKSNYSGYSGLADTAIFSKNSANIPKPIIVSLRPGSICKGDTVFFILDQFLILVYSNHFGSLKAVNPTPLAPMFPPS